jgi:hypothetical protein
VKNARCEIISTSLREQFSHKYTIDTDATIIILSCGRLFRKRGYERNDEPEILKFQSSAIGGLRGKNGRCETQGLLCDLRVKNCDFAKFFFCILGDDLLRTNSSFSYDQI